MIWRDSQLDSLFWACFLGCPKGIVRGIVSNFGPQNHTILVTIPCLRPGTASTKMRAQKSSRIKVASANHRQTFPWGPLN